MIKNTVKKIEDVQMEQVTGGNSVYDGNPLTGMLEMYYQMAMEVADPAARAEAAAVYNETLDKLLAEGVNCAGYRHIQIK